MLSGKIIVVTGGAGLLGRAFCKAIDQSGGIPIIADFDIRGEQFAKDLTNGVFFKLDITKKDSVLGLVDFLTERFGKIDAIVNNAYPRNKNYGRHFFNVEYEDFCENINLNLGGYFLTSQQFSNYFIKQGFGNIINISSIYGVVAPRFEIYDNTEMTMPVEYAVIKSGLVHFTRYLAKYFKGKNVRVNSISLGGINDKQPESFLEKYKSFCLNKGMLDSQDITGAILFLLSDQSEYVNGQNLIIDDGFTL